MMLKNNEKNIIITEAAAGIIIKIKITIPAIVEKYTYQ